MRHIKELKTPTQHSWQSRVLGWESGPLWVASIDCLVQRTSKAFLTSSGQHRNTSWKTGDPSCWFPYSFLRSPSLGVHPALALFLARAFGGGQPTNGSYWLLMLTVTRTKVRSRNTNSSLTPGPSTDQWQNGSNGFCVGQTLSGHVRAIPGLDPAALAAGVQCICCP